LKDRVLAEFPHAKQSRRRQSARFWRPRVGKIASPFWSRPRGSCGSGGAPREAGLGLMPSESTTLDPRTSSPLPRFVSRVE
jgi:hypothetical protein